MIQPGSIWLYNIEKGEKHKVTSGLFNAGSPAFDREGKYFYYVSQMDFSAPMYEDVGTTWIYANTGRLCLVPLSADSLSPTAPKVDNEEWEEEKPGKGDKDGDKEEAEDGKDSGKKSKDKKDDKESKDKKKAEPIKIDLPGFEQRTVLLPVDRGNFSNLCVNNDGKLVYMRQPLEGRETDEDEEPKGIIQILDLDDDKEKEKTVIEGVSGVAISADGKKLLVVKDKTWAIVDAKADQKMDSPLATSSLKTEVDPREEWRQMFYETWRLQRDHFYAPNLHGWTGRRRGKQHERCSRTALPRRLELCDRRDDRGAQCGSRLLLGRQHGHGAERLRGHARMRLRAPRRRVPDIQDPRGRPVGPGRKRPAEPARSQGQDWRLLAGGERCAGGRK
jgi:tricorn protease